MLELAHGSGIVAGALAKGAAVGAAASTVDELAECVQGLQNICAVAVYIAWIHLSRALRTHYQTTRWPKQLFRRSQELAGKDESNLHRDKGWVDHVTGLYRTASRSCGGKQLSRQVLSNKKTVGKFLLELGSELGTGVLLLGGSPCSYRFWQQVTASGTIADAYGPLTKALQLCR